MGSLHMPVKMRSSTLVETSCGYLLQELQLIWDEVGQDEFEREKVLLELEQECLEIYRRKVDSASIHRAHLHQELADLEAEFTHLLVSLGERSFLGRPERLAGTLKEQLDSTIPALQEMQLRKEERVKQFQDIQMQIQKISAKIEGNSELEISQSDIIVNENDISLKKLEEYQVELQRLHEEKSYRLLKVETYISALRNLSATLGMDSSEIITKVHPSLDETCGQQPKDISDTILARLKTTVKSLEEEKHKRLEKLHKLGKGLTNLWNLMDIPYEDRRLFFHVINFIAFSADEICGPGSLALDIIQQAEAEVERLDQLKVSKTKQLFLKKQIELEEICKRSHMQVVAQSEIDDIINLVNSGEIEHGYLLMSMEEQISKAKEEASSRKAITEKVEKLILSCNEEHWLEEYNRDDNRYSVSRGAHKKLKRAERARITISKIPALVDTLITKTKIWEEERKKVFLYDSIPLLAMLEEYNLVRQEKEEEKQKQKEIKRLQSQVTVEQNLFRSRPNTSNRRLPNSSSSGSLGSDIPLNRRPSMGIHQLGSGRIISSKHAHHSIIKESQNVQGQKKFIQKY